MHFQRLLVFAALACALIGCVGVAKREPAIGDVKVEREARKEAITRDYEKRRAAAEISAARLRIEHGDISTASEILESLLSREPSHREALLLLAELRIIRGDTAQAEHLLRQVLREHPDDAEALLTLNTLIAAVAESSGNNRSIPAGLSDEADSEGLLGEVESDLAAAVAMMREGNVRTAISILTNCAKRCPAHPKVLPTLATAHLQVGDIEAAQVVLRQAVSLDNTDALSYFLLGHVLAKKGDHNGSSKSFQTAARLDARFR